MESEVKIYIEELESRIVKVEEKLHELEKRPTARYCELCGQKTFQKFVKFKWEKKGKVFEICPKCFTRDSYYFDKVKLVERLSSTL